MPGHSENAIRVHLCWRNGILRIRHVRRSAEILFLMSQTEEMEKNRVKVASSFCMYILVYTVYTIAVFMCSQIRNAGALTVEMSVQHNLHCHGSKYIALCNAI